MHTKYAFLGMLLAALPLATGRGADDVRQAELAKMAGNWKVTGLEINGQNLLPAGTEIKVVIAADRLKFPATGGNPGSEFTLAIDPTTSPKVVDIVAVTGNNKGDMFEGIYQLDGDTLQICVRTPAGVKDRPTELASKENSGLVLLKLARLKE